MSAQPEESIKGLWNCDNRTYHADTEYVSHSMLEAFRDSIPRFHGLYIDRSIEPDPETPALALGTAFHVLSLEPEKQDDLLVVWPVGDGRKTEIKEARARVSAEAARTGKTVLTAEQWDQAQRMADSARAHPVVKEILDEPGYCEQSVRVECPEVGKRKARFDKLFLAGHILDLKTTRHLRPEAFSRDVYVFGYHRQAACYEDVRDLAMGAGQGIFLYAVTCSIEPFETVAYQMEMSAIGAGRAENYALSMELKGRRESGDWSSRWLGVQRLDIPRWAYREIDSTYYKEAE
jgi:PDDEXK-like uncharacterized protein DUF3799